MLKINLEKELINQNKKTATPKELLLINEYEKIGNINNDALARVGINYAIQAGHYFKEKAIKDKEETLRFDQSRVFHISQIEKICMKYYLKFLPSAFYKGSLDKELPFKITNFEAAYNIKCFCKKN